MPSCLTRLLLFCTLDCLLSPHLLALKKFYGMKKRQRQGLSPARSTSGESSASYLSLRVRGVGTFRFVSFTPAVPKPRNHVDVLWPNRLAVQHLRVSHYQHVFGNAHLTVTVGREEGRRDDGPVVGCERRLGGLRAVSCKVSVVSERDDVCGSAGSHELGVL